MVDALSAIEKADRGGGVRGEEGDLKGEGGSIDTVDRARLTLRKKAMKIIFEITTHVKFSLTVKRIHKH